MRPQGSAGTVQSPETCLLGMSWEEMNEQSLWCQEGPSRVGEDQE